MQRRIIIVMVFLLALVLTGCPAPSAQVATDATSSSSNAEAITARPMSENQLSVATTPAANGGTVVSNEDASPVLVATPAPTIEDAGVAVDWLTTATTDGSFYVLGNPNAPIRLIDYSDFL